MLKQNPFGTETSGYLDNFPENNFHLFKTLNGETFNISISKTFVDT